MGRGLTAPALFVPTEFPRMSLLGISVNRGNALLHIQAESTLRLSQKCPRLLKEFLRYVLA